MNDGRFSWECDTAPDDFPMFYLGRKTCYGREIFTGNYAIRKQTVICYVPKECSINELKFLDTRQLTDYLVRLEGKDYLLSAYEGLCIVWAGRLGRNR